MLADKNEDNMLAHKNNSNNNVSLLALRLLSLSVMVVLLTLHIRSVRVFRWEQSVSGGLLVTYVIAVIGLALCAGIQECGAKVLQAYLCGVGSVLLALNAAVIWRRWRRAGELTRAVVELLGALGIYVRRQVLIKATLSAMAAFLLLIDLTWSLMKSQDATKDQ